MFKLAQSPSYKAKVEVETPSATAIGKTEISHFTAEFARVSTTDLEELRKLPQIDVLKRVLIGWSDLVDENNEAVPYNATNLMVLMDIPQAQKATAETFWNSIFKAKEKN